jgi:hypothetical protein
MKKLNKLVINPEKLMKNEELVALRGCGEGTCGFSVWIPISEVDPTLWNWIRCDVDLYSAQQAVEAAGNGNWCCDSCYQTEYCGGGGY